MKMKIIINIQIVALLIMAVWARADVIELKKNDGFQIQKAGFKLETDKTVHIHIMGAGGKKELGRVNSPHHGDRFNLFTYAWIIDAVSREMVWRMRLPDSESDWWNKWNVEYEGDVDLAKGEYEVYFSMVEPTIFALQDGYMSLGKMWDKLLGADTWWDDHSEDWFCSVENVDVVMNGRAVEEYQEALKKQAIINLTDLGDRAYESRGFSLRKPMDLYIYAIGEGFKGDMYDYGWIVDADTRQRIWEMREPGSEYAGGGVKNRRFAETIRLEAGDYIVYFKTDDNHSDQQWNANPPYDPYFWGITLFPGSDDFNPSDVKKFQPVDAADNALVSLTRLRDNQYEKQGFIVNKYGRFRIYALGEGRGGHMYDYGWITNAENGRTIWKMRYEETVHAGGDKKNREVDEIIGLGEGKYIAHFQTDGSHSYEGWNARRPREPDMWGISIYPLNGEDLAEPADYTNLESANLLADLTRIGDDEYVRKQFRLDEPTRVRVLCLGEGDWDEMYDYGWIKQMETGQTVWEMIYRRTEHAGGARKNRISDVELNLDPGDYIVYYKSDDSHSYRDWNMTPPHDAGKWGITVYRLDR